MGMPLCVICSFSLAAFNICSLCLIFVNLMNMCLGVFCLGFILFGTLWVSWTWVTISFPILGYFQLLSPQVFLMVFLFIFFFWDSHDLNAGAFHIVPKVSEFVLISFNYMLSISLSFHLVYIAVFGVAFPYSGSLWFLFIVDVPCCEWDWTSCLSSFPG